MNDSFYSPIHFKSKKRPKISYVKYSDFNTGIFNDLTIGQNISLMALHRFTRFGICSQKLEQLYLKHTCESYTLQYDLKKYPSEVSEVTKDLIQFLRGLASSPQILVLDFRQRSNINSIISVAKQLQQKPDHLSVLLIASHGIEEIKDIFDRIIVIDEQNNHN